MKKRLLFTFCAMLIGAAAMAEDYFVVALTDSVRIGNMRLHKGYRYDLTPKADLFLSKKSRAILYTKARYVELGNNLREESYKPAQWKSRLEKADVGSGLIGYIMRLYKFRNLENMSQNSPHAGIRALGKGLWATNANGDETFPSDSAKVIGNSVSLKWKLKQPLMQPKLEITDAAGAKVTETDVRNSGTFTFKAPKPGIYSWKVFSPLENSGTQAFVLVVTDDRQGAGLLQSVEEFKKATASFSAETASQMLDDYLETNKIILP